MCLCWLLAGRQADARGGWCVAIVHVHRAEVVALIEWLDSSPTTTRSKRPSSPGPLLAYLAVSASYGVRRGLARASSLARLRPRWRQGGRGWDTELARGR